MLIMLYNNSAKNYVYICEIKRHLMFKYLSIFSFLLLLGCSSDLKQIDKMFAEDSRPLEKGSNIRTIYSDSANLLLILESPLFVSKELEKEKILEYPNGIKISFLDHNNIAKSWLIADRAINKIKDKKFVANGNVKLFNKSNDKLESSELIWDEKNEILYTEKFVKITQPSKGDTLYGYGFVSNREFTEFEIKKKLFGKIIEDIFKDIK